MSDEKGETAPALGVSINAQFAAGRQIVFQTHVDQEIKPEDLTALLKKFNDAIDLEEIVYAIPDLEKQAKVNQNQLYVTEQRIGELDAAMQGNVTDRGRTRPATEKQLGDRANMMKTQERFKELLKEDQDKLQEMKDKVAKRNGTPSPTDR